MEQSQKRQEENELGLGGPFSVTLDPDRVIEEQEERERKERGRESIN